MFFKFSSTVGGVVVLALSVVMAITYVVVFVLHLSAIYYARRRLYPKPDIESRPDLSKLPGVSIIKPIMGVDTNIQINLGSFFQMKYPNYELIFCVADDDDEALPIIHQLLKQHPEIDCQILIGQSDVGVNPKINNMYKGFQIAKYPLILISDSGIFMKSDTLADMVVNMESGDKVGLVHQVPFMHTSISNRFAHLYQLVYFGGWHAKIYMSAAFFGFNCTTGMSCLLRKKVLDEVGIQSFGCYLAEDYFIAKYFYDQNWRCIISGQPAWQNSASNTVTHFQSRIMRWYQLRASMVPHTVLFEPLTECFPNGLLMSWVCYYFLPYWINPAVFFLCHILVWFLLDYLLLCYMHPPGETMNVNKAEYLAVWLFRESTSVFLQMRAVCRRTVEWRDHRFRIHLGGITEEIPTAVNQKIADKKNMLSINSQPPPIDVARFKTNRTSLYIKSNKDFDIQSSNQHFQKSSPNHNASLFTTDS